MATGGRRQGIRRRLATLVALVTIAVVLLFCIPLAFYIRSIAYDRAIDSAELQAHSIAAVLAPIDETASVARVLREANAAASTPAFAYLAGGGVLPPNAPRLPSGLHAIPAARPTNVPMPGGGVQVWVPVHGAGPVHAVMVAVPASLLDKGVARDWALLFGGGAFLVVIAVVLADALGRRIVRPIRDLEAATQRLRDGDLQSRVVPAGPLEVAEVGVAVNRLADRIEQLLASARMAAADLGHRLRTPLTALRLDVESLQDTGARERLVADLEELEVALTRLIHETRDSTVARVPDADLALAVRDRMAFWAVLAASQNRPVEVDVPDRPVHVGLDPEELDAAIDAVVSNVFRHTPEGTGFRVRLNQLGQAPPRWTLVVEDDGPAPAGRPPSGNGSADGGTSTGLGLDIVRRTTARAGGNMAAGRSRDGGFRVVMTLPEHA